MDIKYFLSCIGMLLCILIHPYDALCTDHIKEPSVAGSFYPSDRENLKKTVEAFLRKAGTPRYEGTVKGLIVPHAGYRYSGQVAAYAYRAIQDSGYKNIILIGISHRSNFKGASVYTKGSFRTPLGDIKINETLAAQLLNVDADVKFLPQAFSQEHSLEVQLPFLQTVLNDFSIIPILIGSPTDQTYQHLITSLADMVDNTTLLIASTDLSHYHPYNKAKDMDSRLIALLKRIAVNESVNLLKKNEVEMCGSVPVVITMEVVRRAGANQGVLFQYANSGDITGEKDKVVGYASMGFLENPLTAYEKQELVSLAHRAVHTYITSGQKFSPQITNPKFETDGAVFVTIRKDGHLRGCIGHMQPVMPLYQSVVENAVSASSGDPRFPPIRESELPSLDIEISILSPLRPLKNISDIEIGRHGLVIQKGMNRGILLPQVASEHGWDRDEFLERICQKAGLPLNSWKSAYLFTFTADIVK